MPEQKTKTQMLINYVPGEECRVAVVENGKLEEFHAERASAMSRVGNIYVGRVTNVEAGIQAAFVDFGIEHHGFLHVTDVHPRYFPGEDEETTERVGKKTPRRDRPPIQKCFRRGDEVLVQVLKEGVGTKGPTLTSYLSIPGRFLVMMPQMDRVGVSRKVEDEEQRRKMREILDQLDLPDGFGFIVRTAGMERTKTELKRDLAYLLRLWKDMEARLKGGNKPRLLYSESDLLVRALRDMVGSEIEEVVIDNELALKRASRFLKIVAPRSRVKLLHYPGGTPLFHAFGIEQQIALMHAREVPLPSGGRLVIDETEALVAIDVNSGKMRDARDAETNAYKTNLEAVDEICRQLRLRDLGGIVINDLIDMRDVRKRRDIEARFKERLKRDRARTTVLPISNFGILEMTRQRMRGSHESVHFVTCPTCRGRGLVQRPDSIAADALRNLAAVLDHDRVNRVEMVVAPRVASELLSARRKSLGRIERRSGKHVDVRVSETVPVDRVSFYAYDDAGADVDLEKLPPMRPPTDLPVWESADDEIGWAADLAEAEAVEPEEPAEAEAELEPHPIEVEDASIDGQPVAGETEGTTKKRRRRRRKRRGAGGEPAAAASAAPSANADQSEKVAEPGEAKAEAAEHEAPAEGGEEALDEDGRPRKKRRRRRRRRGRGEGQAADAESAIPSEAADQTYAEAAEPEEPAEPDERRPVVKLAAKSAKSGEPDESEEEPAGVVEPESAESEAAAEQAETDGAERRRRRRRRRRGGGAGEGSAEAADAAPEANGQARPASPAKPEPAAPKAPAPEAPASTTEPKPRRFLYSSRRKLAPSEIKKATRE